MGDLDKPLTSEILKNPQNQITKSLLYIWSLEGFIYYNLNRLIRTRDESQIEFYGPYAAALSYIIYYANSNKFEAKKKGKNTFYRGVQLAREQVEELDQ